MRKLLFTIITLTMGASCTSMVENDLNSRLEEVQMHESTLIIEDMVRRQNRINNKKVHEVNLDDYRSR